MRALDPKVVTVIWSGIEPLIPIREVHHPLGCHRQRASDRDCFQVMLVRLVTGCSWELDLSDVALDGSLNKSPCGGEGTGKNPTDRAKIGWKWSILTDRVGIPIGWVADGANRNDSVLLAPTLDDVASRGLLGEIETLWLDRGYDSAITRERLAARGIDDAVIARKRKRGATAEKTKNQPMGLRWPVERTNAWLSNFGGLRRNTDRKTVHRLAQLALAVAFLLAAKLIDWKDRWSPDLSPIR